jgi:hypothetical protein
MLKTLSVIAFLVVQYSAFCKNADIEFTAVYNSRKHIVKINWQSRISNIKAFIIQRSSDNNAWADIALRQVNSNTANKAYYFEDSKPVAGDNYYRLKYITGDNKIEYSPAVMLITASGGYNWVMYPVPVKDMLTLQYKGSETIKGVITVLIQNSSGNIITRTRSASLTKVIRIPVNNLGSGIYDVRIVVENEIIWNQRFVK